MWQELPREGLAPRCNLPAMQGKFLKDLWCKTIDILIFCVQIFGVKLPLLNYLNGSSKVNAKLHDFLRERSLSSEGASAHLHVVGQNGFSTAAVQVGNRELHKRRVAPKLDDPKSSEASHVIMLSISLTSSHHGITGSIWSSTWFHWY